MRDREFYFLTEAYSRVGGKINESSQQVRLTTDTAMKTLITKILQEPTRFWDLLKKTPGLYGALLIGDMERVGRIFKELGVDVNQINNVVARSLELFKEYQRGTPVEVRKAVKA